MIKFNSFDDVTIDPDGHQWSQVCDGHAEQIAEEDTDGSSYSIRAFGSGLCGVEGCEFEAEYYLDF